MSRTRRNKKQRINSTVRSNRDSVCVCVLFSSEGGKKKTNTKHMYEFKNNSNKKKGCNHLGLDSVHRSDSSLGYLMYNKALSQCCNCELQFC